MGSEYKKVEKAMEEEEEQVEVVASEPQNQQAPQS